MRKQEGDEMHLFVDWREVGIEFKGSIDCRMKEGRRGDGGAMLRVGKRDIMCVGK